MAETIRCIIIGRYCIMQSPSPSPAPAPAPALLYDVLKNGYNRDKTARRTALDHTGYALDADLSDDNVQAYYSGAGHRLIFNVTGTHSLADWVSDVYCVLGMVKRTGRYRRAHDALLRAKDKYMVASATVTGHSLGGIIAELISSGDDVVYCLDSVCIWQTMRKNDHEYRTRCDVVSWLGAGDARMTTLGNSNFSVFGLPWRNALNAHSVDQIRDCGVVLSLPRPGVPQN